MSDISNYQDIIDSRDVIARIEELQFGDYTEVDFNGVSYWIR